MDITLNVLLEIFQKNIWVGLLAVVVYFIWKSAPKLYSLFESYFQSKQKELESIKFSIERGDQKLTSAVEKISEAIHSFEKALIGVKSEIQEDIKESQHSIKLDIVSTREELKKEIRDNKIQSLETKIDRSSRPKGTKNAKHDDQPGEFDS
jgi:Sec-independent protein translocase protein TatA